MTMAGGEHSRPGNLALLVNLILSTVLVEGVCTL